MKDARELVDTVVKRIGRTDVSVSVEDLRKRLSDALDWLRRERVVEERGNERFLQGLLLGLVVGGVLGIFLAPKPGTDSRRDLVSRGIELKEKAGELAGGGAPVRPETVQRESPVGS